MPPFPSQEPLPQTCRWLSASQPIHTRLKTTTLQWMPGFDEVNRTTPTITGEILWPPTGPLPALPCDHSCEWPQKRKCRRRTRTTQTPWSSGDGSWISCGQRVPPNVFSSSLGYAWVYPVWLASSQGSNSPPGGVQLTAQALSSPEWQRKVARGQMPPDTRSRAITAAITSSGHRVEPRLRHSWWCPRYISVRTVGLLWSALCLTIT